MRENFQQKPLLCYIKILIQSIDTIPGEKNETSIIFKFM